MSTRAGSRIIQESGLEAADIVIRMLLTLALSFVTSFLLVGIVRRCVVNLGIVDVPNLRSSHQIPTARGGGAAVALVVLIASGYAAVIQPSFMRPALVWVVAGGTVAVAGAVDDIWGLPAVARLLIHLFAAAFLLVCLRGFATLETPSGVLHLGPATSVFWAVGIVWYINSFNFMDGIDGLAAMQAAFVTLAGAVFLRTQKSDLAALAPLVALAGASMGFLMWNFPRAKIFMGDVGSGFIGFSLALIAGLSWRQYPVSVWFWVNLNGLFLADATVTLLRRLSRAERIFSAHRSHAYQHLSRRWGSHGAVTAAYSAINLFWCLPWAWEAAREPRYGAIYALAEFSGLVAFVFVCGAGRQETARNTIP